METMNKLKIEDLLKKGKIENEFEYQKLINFAIHLENIIEENPLNKNAFNLLNKTTHLLNDFKKVREKKIDFSNPPVEWLKELELADKEAEKERKILSERKELLKKRIKTMKLRQQELGYLLGYRSKSYISNIFNGIKPLKFKDAYLLSKILNLNLKDLTDEDVDNELIKRIEELKKNSKNPERFEKLKKQIQ